MLDLTLEALQVQRLHDSVVCLSRFSESIMLQAFRNKLQLHTINSSKSAYACMALSPSRFAQHYEFVPSAKVSRSLAEEANFSCRVYAKALLSVLRQKSGESRDTGIDKCTLRVSDRPVDGQNRLVICLFCRHGVVKTHRLIYEEVESIHATWQPEYSVYQWTINSHLLKEFMDHFEPKTDQLAVYRQNDRVMFTSFSKKIIDGNQILKQPLQTSVELGTNQFETFAVEEGQQITVNIKDVRAIVNQADNLECHIKAEYSIAGKPFKFSFEKEGLLCSFVLMTISDGSGLPGSSWLPSGAAPVRSGQIRASFNAQKPAQSRPASHQSTQSIEQQLLASKQIHAHPRLEVNPMPQSPQNGAQNLSLYLQDGESENEAETKSPAGEQEMIRWDSNLQMPDFNTAFPKPNEPLKRKRIADIDEDGQELVVGPTQGVSQAKGLFD